MPSVFVVLADDAGPRAGCAVPRVQQGGREEGRAVWLPRWPSPRVAQVSLGAPSRGAEGHARPGSRMLGAHAWAAARGAAERCCRWRLPECFAAFPKPTLAAEPHACPGVRAPPPPHPCTSAVPSRRQYFIAGGGGGGRKTRSVGATTCSVSHHVTTTAAPGRDPPPNPELGSGVGF